MYSLFRIAAKYIRYYCTASNGRGHGIHSPFVYDFIVHVLNDKKAYPAYRSVEPLRKRLLHDARVIEVDDFGAGSISGSKKERAVAAIAKTAAKPKKLAQLLFRIARYYKPVQSLELGTSLGLSAAYLAMGHPAGRLHTCEGAPAIASLAAQHFSQLQLQNISISTGNFDDTLPVLLKALKTIDLAFIDGNHRQEPTLRYFQQMLPSIGRPGIMIFDDIHWSAEMEAAWETIKNNPEVMLTIDLFFIGLVFFNPGFKVKQHFVIRF